MIKKILLLLALLSGLNSKPLSAGQIPMQIIDKGGIGHGSTLAPPRPRGLIWSATY